MIEIRLTLEELLMAAQAGVIRRISSIKEGYNKNKHAEKSDWSTDIDGAAAEMAFSKFWGIYWNGSNRSFKSPDVGNWRIRSTTHRGGCLIIRPNDEDINRKYVMIITDAPMFYIVGHMTPAQARQDKYWRGDSWWVPQKDLIQFEEKAQVA